MSNLIKSLQDFAASFAIRPAATEEMEHDEDEPQTVRLPGFGLDIKTMPSTTTRKRAHDDPQPKSETRFPHAIADFCGSLGVTINERTMLAFLSAITDKPEWDRKVFDEAIVAKWREEASQQGAFFGPKMFEWCVQELREKALKFRETGMVCVIDTEATVVKSDVAVSAEVRDALKAAVKSLENVPDQVKDWHPFTEKQVLDLLHPSLFPVVYGRTKALPNDVVPLAECVSYTGKGRVIPELEGKQESLSINKRPANSWSDSEFVDMMAWDKFQWLPSEVRFSPEDGSSSITSYVNNLHPHTHADMYPVLSQMVDAAIPLWNESLSWFHDRRRILIQGISDADYEIPEGMQSPPGEPSETWLEENPDEEYDKHEDWEWENEVYRPWFESVRVIHQHQPGKFKSFSETANKPGALPMDLKNRFKEEGLQVIFKLATIYLDPERPEYQGGTWHVEGALNEHICATALYYYDQDNITESELSFRQYISGWDMMLHPAQGEYDAAAEIFGVQNETPGTLIQVLGSVKTIKDRLLVFPNVLQHRVSPFRLADASKPGFRKILAMFLVDPHIRVLSTANVPPQRRDWWAEEVRARVPQLHSLPREIFDHIIEFVEDPWGIEDAKKVRLALMEQRGVLNDGINEDMHEAQVSFCEH